MTSFVTVCRPFVLYWITNPNRPAKAGNCVKCMFLVVITMSPAYMLYRLGIPYKQVQRAGCPALVDSYANIIRVANSNPVAARVFLHNRTIALILNWHFYPGKPLSSDQHKQMRQNRMERRDGATVWHCRGWGSGYKERCLLTCL